MGEGEQLYRSYLAGDESGFDGVIELYRESLTFFLLRYLRQTEDAEDAAEDAFVDLLLHPWREGRGASLKTYLFTLGRNRALAMLKKRRRELSFETPADTEDSRQLEDDLCREETRRELLRALDSLPPDYRECLYLLYFEGLSLDETARVMGKRKKQIENLSYRGRQLLRGRLRKEELFR